MSSDFSSSEISTRKVETVKRQLNKWMDLTKCTITLTIPAFPTMSPSARPSSKPSSRPTKKPTKPGITVTISFKDEDDEGV